MLGCNRIKIKFNKVVLSWHIQRPIPLPAILTCVSFLSREWPAKVFFSGSGHFVLWLRLAWAGLEAVVKMMKGGQELLLTHKGAFSPGQRKAFSGQQQPMDCKHTGQQHRESEQGWPQSCLASAHTQREMSCERRVHHFTRTHKSPMPCDNLTPTPAVIIFSFSIIYLSVSRGGKKSPTTRISAGKTQSGHPENCFIFTSYRLHAWTIHRFSLECQIHTISITIT